MNGPFRVVYSGMAREELKSVVAKAARHSTELGRRATHAARVIADHLARDPRTFGEPTHFLTELELEVRLGVVDPIAVSFAVHDRQRLVFVTGFRLMSGG